MNIFVGSLSYEANKEDLRVAFEAFGEVASTQVVEDKFTGQSRGFGFVEMPNQDAAEDAIAGLNGTMLKGRELKVDEARPRQ